MRTTIASIMLLAFAAAVPSAHAALEVDSTGFSLGITDGYYPELTGFDMQLLSDNGSTVQIGLSGAGPLLNPVYSVATEYDYGNGDFGWTQLGAKIKQGYRITSVTLSGVLSGSLDAGQVETACVTVNCTSYAGAATNQGNVTWNITNDGIVTSASSNLDNVTSPQTFSSTLAGGLQGDFTLDINSFLSVYTLAAQRTTYYNVGTDFEFAENVFWESKGSIALGDLTLTVQISPVPEPGTYAMLLAGLGLLGCSAQKRRRVVEA